MRSLWRTVLALSLAPCVVFSSVVAPREHVHTATADHPHAVVHRHFEPHDHDGAEVSHDEGGVIWLDDAVVQPATFEFSIVLAILASDFEQAPEPRCWIARPTDDATPPHGPPRPYASLRAPPLPSL